MFSPTFSIFTRPALLLAVLSARSVFAEPDFERDIRPLVSEFCNKCHSTEKQKGDLDLERFVSADGVRGDPEVWLSVEEQLALGEMPPHDKPQLEPAQRVQLTSWLHGALGEMAREHAGDPGPVVLRRLSNAEYTHTIRDLTGVESLDPAREFPVDGAAGEGFTNAGAALVMSPALLAKYLDSAKDIARHAALLPDGVAFSRGTSERDWTDEKLAAIRAFYARFTTTGSGTAVDLQGIKFDTNAGGILPLEKYFAATLAERAALASGAKSIAAVATERGLSAKYLGTLWTAITSPEPSLLLDSLRARWRDAKPEDAPALAALVAQFQKPLWHFSPVGAIGRRGGAKAWQEPATPPITGREIHLGDTTLTLPDGAGDDRQRIDAALADFRQLFPAALCYSKIVPVDEVVTLTLFYREDDQLRRLLLDDAQAAELDCLWAELRFVSRDALKLVDGFDQLWQFMTQDGDPTVIEPMREPIKQRAADFRKLLTDAEPAQLDAVMKFASSAWRRPLADSENAALRSLYQKLRGEDLPHDAALRLTLARIFTAPAFLYKMERPSPGVEPAPVGDYELASRLSYFLWSSAPDAELLAAAAAGKLHEPDILAAQARRMTADRRIRRLAVEFGAQWLQVRDFDQLDEKSDQQFPTFKALRAAIAEEPVQFFTDFFQHDRPVLSLLDADHTFLNAALAAYYGISGIAGDEWCRVDGLRARGRGGILAFAATLAKQSGASRTSPILRGNWLTESLLGDRLPRPPKGVPTLPDEAPAGLTERQLTERHSTDPKCARCHQRMDPFGFALESFDAIGRFRSTDAAGLPIDTHSKLLDGTPLDGLPGLRAYLLTQRPADFEHQFAKKLLGFALGRAVILTDRPLLDDILAALPQHEDRISSVIDSIVRSPQFRSIRGQDFLSKSNP